MSPLAGPDGTQGGTRAYYPVDRGFYFNGALDEATVDRIFQFLEWSLTEGSDLRYWGVEGETYSVLEDGTKIFINDADRSDDYKDTQIEPLKFIGLPEELKVVNDNAKAKFEKNGIGDLYDYWAGRIEEYNSNRFYDYKDRFVISPTYTEIGSIITETYLAPITGSVILDHNVTRERYNAAVRTWLASGGQKIIDEVNELQKDKSKPSY